MNEYQRIYKGTYDDIPYYVFHAPADILNNYLKITLFGQKYALHCSVFRNLLSKQKQVNFQM